MADGCVDEGVVGRAMGVGGWMNGWMGGKMDEWVSG